MMSTVSMNLNPIGLDNAQGLAAQRLNDRHKQMCSLINGKLNEQHLTDLMRIVDYFAHNFFKIMQSRGGLNNTFLILLATENGEVNIEIKRDSNWIRRCFKSLNNMHTYAEEIYVKQGMLFRIYEQPIDSFDQRVSSFAVLHREDTPRTQDLKDLNKVQQALLSLFPSWYAAAARSLFITINSIAVRILGMFGCPCNIALQVKPLDAGVNRRHSNAHSYVLKIELEQQVQLAIHYENEDMVVYQTQDLPSVVMVNQHLALGQRITQKEWPAPQSQDCVIV